MPEGDTVFRTAGVLHRALAGQRLSSADLRVPALATVDLSGWTVIGVASRGKHLLLRLQPPGTARAATLHCHLGMDGSWRIFRTGAGWRPSASHQVRAVLRTAGTAAVGYQLRALALVPSAEEPALLSHLGPDLLDPDFDPAEAVRRLTDEPTAVIAEALRDQRNLAGIGNVYCAELLFLRGIWPWARVDQVADLPGLVGLARRLLNANRDRTTRTTTGSLRRSETAYVYGRSGSPCRRCGTLISRADHGGRVVYWCPTCQPRPAGTGYGREGS